MSKQANWAPKATEASQQERYRVWKRDDSDVENSSHGSPLSFGLYGIQSRGSR